MCSSAVLPDIDKMSDDEQPAPATTPRVKSKSGPPSQVEKPEPTPKARPKGKAKSKANAKSKAEPKCMKRPSAADASVVPCKTADPEPPDEPPLKRPAAHKPKRC